ncbi:MAG: type VI secretion system baseplate subunit TssK [Pseudomonadales bacterium]|uniref:type VI secretion system baseplate subunit TssK n=1 Tax=unclassified Ketobacter TaxID=2639109 RepID=UPI000C92914A|nr:MULTISPECIES: type VI secretion system baseplate subunit TssK [unclassified Ketobacter]MAA60814.1 type VI secretion system baseplate subunit TssK [Pseudomonadales bacterium]MEC8811999.1 type VI secretion system baseplate subunit TssK [Pseudomonadota bacterium]TNC89434.1 MAG: type VI secretion system baseplate subunit TssK [Alcanivorax sp.]HAG95338.1 type VI secretion system baseplate subunit TssK [Gammaproteobacteria bacterium]MAQ24536.1 type VI secretion system baseplate subunit TssK [Pseu|tara:strand:+ start:1909 stop:3243 length:1335 start_codon:yes stop_codon:yes gene_type:complete
MTISNKVVWSEGLFLRPQHFQQQDRYFERYIDGRCEAIGGYLWGLLDITLDTELLKLGKVGISQARGVFPDGSPFSFPDADALPPVLSVPENTTNEMVYLCLPLRRTGAMEIAQEHGQTTLARHNSIEIEVRNNVGEQGEPTDIDVGQLNAMLKLGSEDLSGYAKVGIARIQEYIADKAVVLDTAYIPPMLDCLKSQVINSHLTEIHGLIHHRAEALSGRLADSGRAGSAEIADYLLLQALNRMEPLIAHISTINQLHPLACFTELVQMAGELATFTTRNKRPPEFPRYQHEELQQIFDPVVLSLRQCLSTVLEQTAVSLELTERKYGIHVAPISDHSIIGKATIVLAVKADVPGNQLRTAFPAQVKIAPVERIREFISAQLPGIGLQALPVAPRQIPYHAGFTYFELDRASDLWKMMQSSGGFAIHLGGNFPGLTMELWTIRD